MVPTTSSASSRVSSAPYASSSGSGHASRAAQSAPPRMAASSARINCASSTIRGMSAAVAGRLDSTSGELRDLAEDRVAAAVVGLVATDRLERFGIEPFESLDHLRCGQLVVVGDGERVRRRYVGPPRRVM